MASNLLSIRPRSPRRLARFFVTCTLLALQGCGGHVRTVSFDDGTRWQEVELRDSRRHGRYRRWFADGTLELEAAYVAGLPDGRWSYYSALGELEREESWSAGARDGAARSWYPGGQLKSEGGWSAGERVGQWRYFHADGSLDALSVYEEGTLSSMTRSEKGDAD